MQRRLPPFAAIRAFEAVGRTRSFTGAAEELGVTQAAVSRQVRALEEILGQSLIRRLPGGNELTDAGRLLLRPMQESLDRMEEAFRLVSGWQSRSVLTVSVAPFFSSVWLTPRIMSFLQQHPQVDLRLHHSYAPPDYRREVVDLGINWGNGAWGDVTAEKVMDGSLIAVCAPDYPAAGELQQPADLLSQPLFYEFRLSDWQGWMKIAGVPGTVSAVRIDDSHALRQTVLEGHGIGLICRELVKEDLTHGRLRQLFEPAVDTGDHYFLNYPAGHDLSRAAKQFRRWLRRESSLEPEPDESHAVVK